MNAEETIRPVNECTAFELIDRAIARCSVKVDEANHTSVSKPQAAREFAEARTQLEYAQMRYTRGVAMLKDVFRPVDLESVDAIADRRAFLDSVEAERQR